MFSSDDNFRLMKMARSLERRRPLLWLDSLDLEEKLMLA